MLEGKSALNLKIVIKAYDQQFETHANAGGYWKIENPIKMAALQASMQKIVMVCIQ